MQVYPSRYIRIVYYYNVLPIYNCGKKKVANMLTKLIFIGRQKVPDFCISFTRAGNLLSRGNFKHDEGDTPLDFDNNT